MRTRIAPLVAPLVLLGTALAASSAGGAEPISWEEADRHVGEEQTVEGRIMGVHCSPLSCLLAFDPSFDRFTAVIQARNFDAFPPEELDGRYSGRRVLVHGTIRKLDGKPEIVVEKPEDLRVVTTKRRAEREADQLAQEEQQVVALERLGDVLARVEEITERMAAMQERMEATLALLEQRTAALAAVQQYTPVEPPPAPSYGEPQPRPGFEALRTIKRGMSRTEVQRLIGEPSYVESSGTGWATWFYGYGRSVSFDNRGKVQALSGFPAP